MAVEQGRVIEVTVHGEFVNGQEIINVFQMRKTDAGTISDADALTDLGELFDILYALVVLLMNADVVFRKIRGRFQGESGVILGDYVFPVELEGAVAGDPAPAGVCALISFPTNISRVVMRKYFGPPAEAMTDGNGQMSSTALGLMGDIAAVLLLPMVGSVAEWEFGYVSPKADGWITPNAAISYAEPAYQRRRRLGSGS